MIFTYFLLILAVASANNRHYKPKQHKSPSYIRTVGDVVTQCREDFRNCVFEQECLESLEDCGFFNAQNNLRSYVESELGGCLNASSSAYAQQLVSCVSNIQQYNYDEPTYNEYNSTDSSDDYNGTYDSGSNEGDQYQPYEEGQDQPQQEGQGEPTRNRKHKISVKRHQK